MGELNLSTTVERKTITIDGKKYEIRNANELKYKESAWYLYASKEIPKITKQLEEEYNEELAEKFDDLLNRAARNAFVEIPEEVYDKLSDEQKIKVVEFFVEAAQEARQNQNGQSQDSSDSTEEQRENGSTLPTG